MSLVSDVLEWFSLSIFIDSSQFNTFPHQTINMFAQSIIAFCMVAQVAAFAPSARRTVSMAVKSSTDAAVVPEEPMAEVPGVPLSDPATFAPAKKIAVDAKWFPFGVKVTL